jgi:isopenicillin-N epimerase
MSTRPPEPLSGARDLFTLDPDVAHLNHGSFGAMPRPVQEAQQRLRDEIEANPMRFFAGGELESRLLAARRRLATFTGLDPDGTAIVPNATAGASIVLGSIRLEPGDEIVRTDHAYGAVAFAMDRRARETGAVVRVVPLPIAPTDEEVVEGVRAVLGDRTRLVVLDFVTSPTARLFPVAAVHALLRKRGIPLFVDAAHGPGLVDTPPTGDFWVGNLHKWAYAPRPTALFAVAPAYRDRVRPTVVSWRDPDGFPSSVEWVGVVDHTPALAAPAGADVLEALGTDAVRVHNASLAAYGAVVVADALGVEPLPDPSVYAIQEERAARPDDAPESAVQPELRTAGIGIPVPMRVVPLPRGHGATREGADDLRRGIARDLGAEVAINAFDGVGLLRLSGQVYNRAEEYERLAERLPGYLRGREG